MLKYGICSKVKESCISGKCETTNNYSEPASNQRQGSLLEKIFLDAFFFGLWVGDLVLIIIMTTVSTLLSHSAYQRKAAPVRERLVDRRAVGEILGKNENMYVTHISPTAANIPKPFAFFAFLFLSTNTTTTTRYQETSHIDSMKMSQECSRSLSYRSSLPLNSVLISSLLFVKLPNPENALLFSRRLQLSSRG